MTSLESLPDDLFLDIMKLLLLAPPQHLGPTPQRNHFLPLIRCSRRLYRLGEPILYRKVHVDTSNTLIRFTKTILAHPDLADHVKVVILKDGGRPDPKDPKVANGLTTPLLSSRQSVAMRSQASDAIPALPSTKTRIFNSEEVEIMEATMLSLSPEKAALWTRAVLDGAWMPLAGFTLCLLSNIEDLQIENCHALRWQTLGKTRNLFSYPFPFAQKHTAKLQNLTISYNKRTGEDGLHVIPTRLLALPTLHTFSGDMMRESSWTNTTPCQNFSIRRLQLDRCNFSPTALENLLNSCPKLEYLKYEHDKEEEEHPFHPDTFDHALASLKGVLKELILYRTAWKPGAIVTDSSLRLIKCLPQFQKLSSLYITTNLLLGPQRIEREGWYNISLQNPSWIRTQPLVSCLPSCLEHLKLKNCGEDIFEQVTRLVEEKDFMVPKLKSIIIEFVHVRSSYDGGGFLSRAWGHQLAIAAGPAAELLQCLCKEKGVLLDIWYN